MATEMLPLLTLWCLLGACSQCILARTVLGEEPAPDSDEEIEMTFKHLCEGIEDELKTCNKRLMEKAEYSGNLENDLFILKRQLRQIRVTCKDAAQASNVQISALQIQLDGLLKELGEKTEGPARAVLEILQKYVKVKKLELEIAMEPDTEKIKEKEKQLKEAKGDLEQAIASLSKEKKCQTGSSSEIVEINALQEKIDKLRTKSDSSAQIAKLQKQLEEKLKGLEDKGDTTTKKVTQIMGHQDEIVDIERRLSDMQKAEAERRALKKQLEEATGRLSTLKEEKQNSPNKVTDEEIHAVERDIKTLGKNLQAVEHILSEKQDLENKLQEKKKNMEDQLDVLKTDGHDLVSKILDLQFQLRETQVQAHGEKVAADFEIEDLQKQLKVKEKQISDLLVENQELQSRKSEHCKDIEDDYNEIVDMIQQLPEHNLKLVLEIVSLGIEIDSININIESETSESKIRDLKKEHEDKTDQLKSKKQELYENDASAKEVLNIIEKLEQLWKLQKGENVDQIKAEEQKLLKLISQLDDSNPAKILLKNMAMQSDATWLKKQIAMIKEETQTQITELQEKISKSDELLKKKTAELVKAQSDVLQLTKDITSLRAKVESLQKQKKDLELASAKRLEELNKDLDLTKQELEKGNSALKGKDIELAAKVNKITELIEKLKKANEEANRKDQETSARISDLETKLKQEGEEKNKVLAEKKRLQKELAEAKECAELRKTHEELQANFQNTVSKLNNSLARQIFTVQALNQEVEMLKKKISSSEGNADALEQQLSKKTAELEKVKKELKGSRVEYFKVLEILESLKKINRQQEQTIAAYIAEITRMEQDVEGLMAKLAALGEVNGKQTIEVIFLKQELEKFKKLYTELQKETTEKVAALEEKIAEKNKEIAYLKKSGCGSDQLKKQIAQLQQEVAEKEQQLNQLKRTARTQMEEIQKHLAEKTKKLEASEEKLKEKDSENAGLINRLAELGKQIEEITSGKETLTRVLQGKISDLKYQVDDQEKEISKLRKSNAELRKTLGRKEDELSEVKQKVTEKDAALSELAERVRRREAELAKEQNAHAETREKNKDLLQQVKETEAKLKQLQAVTVKPSTSINVVSPVLDPDTAHRRLLLYDANTKVKVSKLPRIVPDNPERYDTALAALGNTGYASGRQYWEVRVEGRTCFVVGVASKSVQRKGEIAYSPKYGYWTILRRRDTTYLALTNKPTVLTMSDKLSVIGVLVDFNKGKITFYNVKTKTTIFTFDEDTFREPLYPYIATCSEETGEPPIVFIAFTSALWLESS